jgi:hypothetical protein
MGRYEDSIRQRQEAQQQAAGDHPLPPIIHPVVSVPLAEIGPYGSRDEWRQWKLESARTMIE